MPAYGALYDKNGFNPNELKSFSDVRQLPVIDKPFVKKHYSDLVDVSLADRSVVRYTGGSTGTPMKFLLDKEKIFFEKAFFYYIWKKHGYEIGDKCLFVKGENIKGSSGRLAVRDGIYNYLKLDSNYLNESSNLPDYDRAIKKFKPRKVFGYPSAIYQLALLYSRSCVKPPEFDLIMLASENTYPDQIAFIKSIFSCDSVFFHYGHSEYAVLATKYHDNDCLGFNPFYGHAEIIKPDGQLAEAGESGEIIATSYSKSMPLIRYRTNDFAVVSGYQSNDYMRSYLAVDKIEGRLQEYIVTEDQRLVSICTMGAAHFEELGPVLDSQYFQDEPGRLVFKVCCPEDEYTSTLEKNIKRAIERKLENKVKVYVKNVPDIRRTSTGKKIMIEQKLDINQYL
ncbi:phenylacetate--CoA ligase family protein [Oceanisphaera psychrotolerans]|nr:phenylacetate--CoA ligase family protein [Oceanisphaera psychrotolerans]